MKKTLSAIISIAMIISMIAMLGIGASAASVVECASWADVKAAVEADAKASIKLTASVTANDTIASFAGTFNGNGKTVTAEKTMFAAAADGASFKNFTIKGEVGATPLVGTASGNVTITKVTSKATVTASSSAAAFIGKINEAATVTLTKCVNSGDITGSANMAGFIGQISAAATITLTNCVNKGTITTTGSHASGFIACIDPSGAVNITFESCANNGKIVGDQTGKCEVSGFVTYLESGEASTITFKNCLSAGAFENKSENSDIKYSASGFMARAKKVATVTIENCLSIVPSFTVANGGAGFFWTKCESDKVTFTGTNSYYLANENVSALTESETAAGGFTAVTADQLASGEISYKLGAAWGQKLGGTTATVPSIGGAAVLFDGTNYYNDPNASDDTPETGDNSLVALFVVVAVAAVACTTVVLRKREQN